MKGFKNMVLKVDDSILEMDRKLNRRSFVKLASIVVGAAVATTAGVVAIGATHAAGLPKVTFYRLVNKTTGDHFYTANTKERDGAINQYGYTLEGPAGVILSKSSNSATPFYRLNNGRDHFYTADPQERDNAIAKYGYKLEGTAGYVYAQQVSDTAPFYRLNNGYDHFYTLSASERDNAIAKYGYRYEGVACYIYSTL